MKILTNKDIEFKTFVEANQNSLPEWYDESVHKKVCELVLGSKLNACKFLCEYSYKMKTRELYGLQWAKEKVVDLIVKDARPISLTTLIEVNEYVKNLKESPERTKE